MGETSAQVATGVAIRANDENSLVMFDADDGMQLSLYADAIDWAAGSAGGEGAWAGSLEPGDPHYYRLQGPRLLIEWDNTQRGANHAHSVWRDLESDFGADVLARHHTEHDHGA